MRIAVYEAEKWEEKIFQGLRAGHEIHFFQAPLTENNLQSMPEAEILSTFIYSDLSRKVLGRLGRLKCIVTRSTGFDHIDLEYCRSRGITVSNVPTYGDHTVAEHVFALLFSVSRRLCEAIDRTRKGDFSSGDLQGFDLRGKMLGVIGTGNIGRRVIEIATGLGMKVLAFDVHPDLQLAGTLDFRYVNMDALLALSDIITLHVPANEKTHHLLSRDEFQQMKEGVILINTARGSVVDHQALARALADGKVAAAGLDVLPDEPLIQEEAELLRSFYQKTHDLEQLLTGHTLLHMRNVLITPHIAFNTREAVERILETSVENIESFVSGNPQNVVVGPEAQGEKIPCS
jgi:D-lactate dehydrogenase